MVILLKIISAFLKNKRFQWQLRRKDTTKQILPISLNSKKRAILCFLQIHFSQKIVETRQNKAPEKCSTTEKSFLEVMEKGKRERRGKLSGIKE